MRIAAKRSDNITPASKPKTMAISLRDLRRRVGNISDALSTHCFQNRLMRACLRFGAYATSVLFLAAAVTACAEKAADAGAGEEHAQAPSEVEANVAARQGDLQRLEGDELLAALMGRQLRFDEALQPQDGTVAEIFYRDGTWDAVTGRGCATGSYGISGDQFCVGRGSEWTSCRYLFRDDDGRFFVQRTEPQQHLGSQVFEVSLKPHHENAGC